MKFLAYLFFLPLQLVWLPLSLIGVIMVGYRQLVISKRLGGVPEESIERYCRMSASM